MRKMSKQKKGGLKMEIFGWIALVVIVSFGILVIRDSNR